MARSVHHHRIVGQPFSLARRAIPPVRDPGPCLRRLREACARAVQDDAILAARDLLDRRGLSPERCLALLRQTAETERLPQELLDARGAADATGGPAAAPAAFERALLVPAALRLIDQIPGLPLDASSKQLLGHELEAYANPPATALARFALTGPSFIPMARIVTLLRFRGGVFDWDVSGFPRSWFLKMPRRLVLPTARFVVRELRGVAPLLVWHLAGTMHRYSFLLEPETRKSFYRLAAAAERQPHIRGLMAASWMLSTETHRVSPHLAFVGAPFLEAGGVYTEAGPAAVINGFLEGGGPRRRLYAAGEYHPAIGVVICSRAQAIRWKARHPELEAAVRVDPPGD